MRKKMGSRTRLAWLSSCKIVRFECSCCFCSCLWALAHQADRKKNSWVIWMCLYFRLLSGFFLCILPIFCLFNEFLWERALNMETLVHYSLFGTVLCLKGKFTRKDHFRRAVGIDVTHQFAHMHKTTWQFLNQLKGILVHFLYQKYPRWFYEFPSAVISCWFFTPWAQTCLEIKDYKRAWLHMVVEGWSIFMSSLIFGGAVMPGSTVLSFLETLSFLQPLNRLAWLPWAFWRLSCCESAFQSLLKYFSERI